MENEAKKEFENVRKERKVERYRLKRAPTLIKN